MGWGGKVIVIAILGWLTMTQAIGKVRSMGDIANTLAGT